MMRIKSFGIKRVSYDAAFNKPEKLCGVLSSTTDTLGHIQYYNRLQPICDAI